MNNRSIKINLFSAILFLTLLSFGSVDAQTLTPRYNTSMTSNTNGFYESLPKGYSATGTTLYPLLIFSHGIKEYGNGSSTELWMVRKNGPFRVIKEGLMPSSFTVGGKTFKFIMIAPQWKSGASVSNVNGVIDYCLKHYKIDPKRIYLTGLSIGGGVVENVAADPTVGKRIAAVVEFCGTSSPSLTRATNIVKNGVGFWGVHNKNDDWVSSSKTIGWVNNILAVKSTASAKKTIPIGTSHDCWTKRYYATWTEDGLSIYQWMLKHARTATTTTSTGTASTKVEAEKYSAMKGVALETTTDVGGGQNVRAIDKDDWMDYKITTSTSGTYTFTFRLATVYTGAKFNVLNSTGKILATVSVPNTGGGQVWKNVTASVTLPSGTQTLRLYSTTTIRWNINYFTFAKSTTAGTQADTNAVTEEASATTANGVAITPNPLSNRFVLLVNNTYTGTMNVQIVDVSGVVRKEFRVAKNATGTVQTYLSAGALPAGNYFVKVQMDQWSQTKQVVKL